VKELWKFCDYVHVEVAAAMLVELSSGGDLWEREAPRQR